MRRIKPEGRTWHGVLFWETNKGTPADCNDVIFYFSSTLLNIWNDISNFVLILLKRIYSWTNKWYFFIPAATGLRIYVLLITRLFYSTYIQYKSQTTKLIKFNFSSAALFTVSRHILQLSVLRFSHHICQYLY